VNAHFQNGIAERRIRELQDQARTNLVFAQHRWPTAISSNLWPYAVRHVNEVFNSTPHSAQEQSPTAKFTGTTEEPKTKHFHHFGCPVYVTDTGMQQGRKGPKWLQRARLGLYLGTSPIHSRSVALVLNLDTGLASPQFHVAFDDLFETVQSKSGNPRHSLWQQVTGFTAPTAVPLQQNSENGSQTHRLAVATERLASWVRGNTPGTSSVFEGAPGSRASASHDASPLSNEYHQASPTEGIGHGTDFNREPLREDRGSVHADMDADASAPHTSVTDAPAADRSNQDGLRRSVRRRKAPQRFRDSSFPVAFSSQIDGEAL
jgi:hypothetical protein